jgi:tyrosinase
VRQPHARLAEVPIMRTCRCGSLLLMLAAVAAMTIAVNTGANAVAAEPETLATSAGVPVALGAGPVAVTLAPAAGKALSARLAAVGQDRKLYLVAKGLGTDQPPETIYQLYLGLPQGTAPNPNGPYYVGALNFFNAVRRGAEAGQPDPRFLSFEVTSLLKTLRTGNALGDNATVTIVPAGKPRASARPVIAEIALVAQ